jgi:hypothetical protein
VTEPAGGVITPASVGGLVSLVVDMVLPHDRNIVLARIEKCSLRLTVGQDIKTLLAAHKVIGALLDGWHIAEVNVEELKSSI